MYICTAPSGVKKISPGDVDLRGGETSTEETHSIQAQEGGPKSGPAAPLSLTREHPNPGPRVGAWCLCKCVCTCVCTCTQVCIGWCTWQGPLSEACPHSAAGYLEWAVCSARSWSRGPRKMLAWKETSRAMGQQSAMALTPLRPGLRPPLPTSPTITTLPLSPPALPSSIVAPSGASQVSPEGWRQVLPGS